MTITVLSLDGFPGRSGKSLDELLVRQPKNVVEALRIPGVGRKTSRQLIELGMLVDPEGVQSRARELHSKSLTAIRSE
jgi:hypothetical protein